MADVLIFDPSEFEVLESINFETVMFDVITVETEKNYRAPSNTIKITALLRSKGYNRVWCSGRNIWFTHNSFNISSREKTLQLGCSRDP
jgi:hypothetical protein